MKTEEMLPLIINFFKDTEVEKVYLFGSRARHQESETSDIDLLVFFPQNINLLRIVKYKRLLENKLNFRVDMLTPNSISEKIFPHIKNDLKLIYEFKG